MNSGTKITRGPVVQSTIDLFETKSDESQLLNETNLNIMQPSWNDYEIVETLGEGTYGKVYKVKSKN